MLKKFENPELEIYKLNVEDIITSSSGDGFDDELGEDELGWG